MLHLSPQNEEKYESSLTLQITYFTMIKLATSDILVVECDKDLVDGGEAGHEGDLELGVAQGFNPVK